MSGSNWLLYATAVLLSTVTPGPAVLLSMSNALAQRASGFRFVSATNFSTGYQARHLCSGYFHARREKHFPPNGPSLC